MFVREIIQIKIKAEMIVMMIHDDEYEDDDDNDNDDGYDGADDEVYD